MQDSPPWPRIISFQMSLVPRFWNLAWDPVTFCFRMKNSYGSLTILYSPFYSFLYIKTGPDHPCLQGNIVYFIDSHQCYFHFLSSLNRKSAGRYCLQFCSCKLYILSLISFLPSKKSLFLMPFKRLFFHLLIPWYLNKFRY